MCEHRNFAFASYPELQLLSTSPESVLPGRSVPMDKEASHGGMKRDVLKWDSLRSKEMTSRSKDQLPARKISTLIRLSIPPSTP